MRKTDSQGKIQQKSRMGQNRNLDDRDKSPAAKRLNVQSGPNNKKPKEYSTADSSVETGMLHQAEMGPKEKKN